MNLTQYINQAGVASQIIEGLAQLVDDNKADEILSVLDSWKVVINRRTTTRHGSCHYNKKEIELHVHLLSAGNEDARNQTLIHEIAHVVVDLIWGYHNVRGHGREWKRTMIAFGAPPARTSSYATMQEFKMKKAKIIYACNKCECEFPAMRKKKYAPENYVHKGCGGHLYLKENRVSRLAPVRISFKI